jgi:hypothetical protein
MSLDLVRLVCERFVVHVGRDQKEKFLNKLTQAINECHGPQQSFVTLAITVIETEWGYEVAKTIARDIVRALYVPEPG